MFIHQPFRRSRRRRAKYDLQPGLAEGVHRFVEPVPTKLARLGSIRLQANSPMRTYSDAEFAHPPRVLGPPGFRPVLRVVADAEHTGPLRR